MAGFPSPGERSPLMRHLGQFGLHPLTHVFASGKQRAELPASKERVTKSIPIRLTISAARLLQARRIG